MNYLIAKNNPNSRFKPVQVLLFLNMFYLLYSIYSQSLIDTGLSAGTISFALFIFINIDIKHKQSLFRYQLSNSNETNMKLSHQITRLKLSNEQYKRILSEKDMELFQVSRHVSLAEITTGIAHELTQPLTGIKGIAQNMIDDINYREFENMQALSELVKICSLVDKSSFIIDHIRNFSQKSGFSMKAIDLNKTIANAIDLISLQLEKNDISLVVEKDIGLPNIFGNNISLEQLIINLTLNSKDAIIEKRSQNPDLEGYIKISTLAKTDSVLMSIEDNGIGIPDDIIQHIWAPFFTTKKRNNGTGIGLSISNKIIKEHQGKASIETNEGGSTFIISFPLNIN